MSNPFARLLCVGIAVLAVGCTPPPESKKPEPATTYVTITGKVVDENGRPIRDASVMIGDARVAVSNAEGNFGIRRKLRAERLALNVTAPGRVAASRPVSLTTAGDLSLSPLVLPARAAPTVLQAERGGRVRLGAEGALDIPPNAFVSADGQPARGRINVSVTPINVLDPRSLRTAPGDFTAKAADGTTTKLQSFGMFDLQVTDAEGRDLSVAKGVELPITTRIPDELRPPAGDTIGFYRFDRTSGFWVQAGILRPRDSAVFAGVVTGVGEWNADNVYETTCITIRAVSIDLLTQAQVPFPNAEVWAQGVDYAGTSIGQTDGSGSVCLAVKRNASISINAYSGNWTTMGPTTVQTPNVQSGTSDCGDLAKCPLVTTLVLDLVVGLPE